MKDRFSFVVVSWVAACVVAAGCGSNSSTGMDAVGGDGGSSGAGSSSSSGSMSSSTGSGTSTSGSSGGASPSSGSSSSGASGTSGSTGTTSGSSSGGGHSGSGDSGAVDSGGRDSGPSSSDGGGPAGKMLTVEMTLYGWPDNSPPGNGIAYPQIHQGAGGTGTYADPITFATDQAEEPPGTIIYVPTFLKYGIMEDDCVQCDSDWENGMKYHFDFWLNSNASSNAQAVENCEGSWTRNMMTVEVGPPSDRTVDPTPLFNTQTNMCSTTP